ncbi:MAG: pyruvate ferredoxin oxidoreductase, partial [Cloacibacillus sp.]
VSYGSLTMSEYYFEIKRNQMEGMNNVPRVYEELSSEMERLTGRRYGAVDAYRADDAEYLIIIMSSATGVVKDTVDELREKGIKAGCLRVRFFRPFPSELLASLVKGKLGAAVLDRSASIGGTAPLAAEVKSALYGANVRVPLQEYIFGLGGRDFYPKDAEKVFMNMVDGDYDNNVRYIGLLDRGDKNVG